MKKIVSIILLINTVLLVANCSGSKKTMRKIDSDSNNMLIQIDSIKYYYSICFSDCPTETTIVIKNGNVRIFNRDSAWVGQTDYKKTMRIFYYLSTIKQYEWKCKEFCAGCDGNQVDFEIYSQGSRWKIPSGAFCTDAPFSLVALGDILDNLIANAYWKSDLPPLHYKWPADSINLRMEIEKTERKLSQLKNQDNEFKKKLTKISIDSAHENQ